jgi:hypothetical protein
VVLLTNIKLQRLPFFVSTASKLTRIMLNVSETQPENSPQSDLPSLRQRLAQEHRFCAS